MLGRSKSAGEVWLRKDEPIAIANSSKTGSYPTDDGVDDVSKVEHSLSGMDNTINAVPLQPLRLCNWQTNIGDSA